MTEMNPTKKQKLDTGRQCEFYLEKKRRTCRMEKLKGSKFCADHGPVPNNDNKGERVPCPKDPKHTVWSKMLDKHLSKCNKTKIEVDPWFSLDINVQLQNCSSSDAAIDGAKKDKSIDCDSNDQECVATYQKLIPKLQELQYDTLELKQSTHEGLNNRMNELQQQKHAIQQSSLIGNLRDLKLLQLNNCFLEFGCGRGELSRYLNFCLMEDCQKTETGSGFGSGSGSGSDSYGFGLIDRGKNRMKMDTKIIKDVEAMKFPIQPKIVRTRIDIKDLDLNKFSQQFQQTQFVCISKHLCGAATDLTLKSILNSQLVKQRTLEGLMVAMCCRHVCDYDQLLDFSKDYIQSKLGIEDRHHFSYLKKIASWAVCGRRDGASDNDGTDHITKLSYLERENLGQLARRVIDESRVYALKQLLPPDYDIRIQWYVPREITLENVVLIITKKEQQVLDK